MKNLFKLLMAGVLLTSVSCVQDITEDIAVGVPGATTEFTVGIEAPRVILGDKDALGKYPLYWSNGDKISINGIASAGTVIEEGVQTSQANFVVTPGEDQVLVAPFNVLYPSNTAGQVVFKTLQTFTEGTFANGTTPMYAYSEESATLTLKHLAGALKIGVKGEEGVLVKRVLVESTNGEILAGTFDIDCSTGVLTATEDVNIATAVTSTAGVALSPEAPTYFYIAIPAGEYAPLNVTIYTTDGKTMHVSAKDAVGAESFVLEAGQIKTFNELTFVENATIFEIFDVDGLFEFADMVKAGTFAKNYDKAVLAGDIYAASGSKPWETLEGFNGIFDGQNFKIYDLSAPLFGETAATIKNVILAAPRISVSDRTDIGAIACKLLRKDPYAGTLINCHTVLDEGEGLISYSGQTAYTTLAEGAEPKHVVIGGLVGQCRSSYCSIVNCSNGVKIEFPVSASAPSLVVGGVIGYSAGCKMTDVENTGEISTKGTIQGGAPSLVDVDAVDTIVALYVVGGVAGYGNGVSLNVTNRGKVNIGGTFYFKGQEYPCVGLAGCFGANNGGGTADNLHNHGLVTVTTTFEDDDIESNTSPYIGGVIGYGGSTKINNCSNNAKLEVSATVNYSSLEADNDGSKIYNGNAVRMAGVCARGANATGYESDNIVNHAEIVCAINAPKTSVHVGGVFCDNNKSLCTNVVNNGKITVNENAVIGKTLSLGGVASRHGTLQQSGWVNNGAIEFKGKALSLIAGGVVGYSTQPTNNAVNTGNITIAGQTSCTDGAYCWKVGGVVGGGSPAVGCVNGVKGDTTKGTINISTTGLVIANAWPSNDVVGTTFGGIIGHGTSNVTSECKNYGTINFTSDFLTRGGTTNVYPTIGGISGYCGSNVNYSENHGTINVSGNHPTAGGLMVAGICARNGNGKGMLGNYNGGAINVNVSNIAGSFGVSGGACSYPAGTTADCINDAPITVTATNTTGADSMIGGILNGDTNAKYEASYTNLVNTEKGVITVKTGTKFKTIYIGGISGRIGSTSTTLGKPVSNCHNHGKIVFEDGVEVTEDLIGGGLIGQFYNGKADANYLTDCSNSGSFTIGACTLKDTYVGGILGSQSSKAIPMSNVTNTGAISWAATNSGEVCLAGVVASNTQSRANWSNISNSGDITATGTGTDAKVQVAGVCARGVGVMNGFIHYGNVSAAGYTNVGAISGEARNATDYASACQLGGTILRGEATEAVTLTAENFTEYVYGGTAAYEESDACTLYVPQPETPEQPAPETPEQPTPETPEQPTE